MFACIYKGLASNLGEANRISSVVAKMIMLSSTVVVFNRLQGGKQGWEKSIVIDV